MANEIDDGGLAFPCIGADAMLKERGTVRMDHEHEGQ